jgi:hypothetical protein
MTSQNEEKNSARKKVSINLETTIDKLMKRTIYKKITLDQPWPSIVNTSIQDLCVLPDKWYWLLN